MHEVAIGKHWEQVELSIARSSTDRSAKRRIVLMTAYSGTIAITDQLEAIVLIDDLDSPSWHGTIVGRAQNWEEGRVTVRLLEGPRAKHIAEAELDTDSANRVELRGLTAFMPGAEE